MQCPWPRTFVIWSRFAQSFNRIVREEIEPFNWASIGFYWQGYSHAHRQPAAIFSLYYNHPYPPSFPPLPTSLLGHHSLHSNHKYTSSESSDLFSSKFKLLFHREHLLVACQCVEAPAVLPTGRPPSWRLYLIPASEWSRNRIRVIECSLGLSSRVRKRAVWQPRRWSCSCWNRFEMHDVRIRRKSRRNRRKMRKVDSEVEEERRGKDRQICRLPSHRWI